MTITVAAKRLGVNERRVRRWSDKLSGADRSVTGAEPLMVSLSAMSKLLGVPVVSEEIDSKVPEVSDIVSGQVTGADRSVTGKMTGALSDQVTAGFLARIADKDSEIAFLREALQREQETSRRAMDAQNALAAELAEARKQASVLIAATAGAFKAPVQIAEQGKDSVQNDSTPSGEAVAWWDRLPFMRKKN